MATRKRSEEERASSFPPVSETIRYRGKMYGRAYAKAIHSLVGHLLPRQPDAVRISIDHSGISSTYASKFADAFNEEVRRVMQRRLGDY